MRPPMDNMVVELWKTDGTEAGTVIVKNIAIEDDPDTPVGSSPEQLTVFNNELYFFANDGPSGFEPWKTDGTEIGTVMVKNIGIDNGTPFPSSPDNLTYWAEAGGRLFFTAETGNSGIEPYTTDGTSTAKLDDLNVVPRRDDVFRVFKDRMFFFADDDTHGFELWVSNGTLSGADLIKDIYTTPINAPLKADGLKFLTEYQGQLFFTADDGFVGTEVWVTQGTEISSSQGYWAR